MLCIAGSAANNQNEEKILITRTLIGAAVALALAVTPSFAQDKAKAASESKQPAKAKKAKPQSAQMQLYVQGDSAFDVGSSELKPDGRAAIDKMLKTTREGTKRDPRPFTISSVILTGHADRLEPKADALALKRAQAVKDYLVSKGVDEKFIFWEGKGAKSPMGVTKFCDDKGAKAELAACLQPNRRVAIEMGGTKPPKPKKK